MGQGLLQAAKTNSRICCHPNRYSYALYARKLIIRNSRFGSWGRVAGEDPQPQIPGSFISAIAVSKSERTDSRASKRALNEEEKQKDSLDRYGTRP